ncbi:MAG: M48 family metallopeptidase [Rothia sp. (in: high G+C Gram-positive bacteria)]|nr:M48 family metallopeptidase [Rothia sp. (in: high G+C Gram-positive bacteria)]
MSETPNGAAPNPNNQHPQMPQGNQQGDPPLPDDLSRGWLPEDTRQRPASPLPAPKLFGFQSLLPFKLNNAIRHPAEVPLVAMAFALTFLVYVGGAIFLTVQLVQAIVDPYFYWVPSNLTAQLIAIAIYLPILAFFVRAMGYAQMRIQGVRISPTQFPEAYQMVVEAAHAAGLRRVPDAYVVLGNGAINAFAAGHGHRRFIVIFSDLFEIGGKARNPEALRFIIGHEVGHIAAGHVSYFRLIFTSFFMQIPILGNLLSRTQEYTADNFGYRFCPEGAETTTTVLAAGKYLMNDVNFHELANRAVYERGFFTWLSNLNTTHPPVTWRAHALRDRSEPGRLIWRPKNNPPYPLSAIPAAEPAQAWPDPLQAQDFLATYPEREDNQHWGSVQTVYREPAQYRDRRVGDMLFTGWVPPQYRTQGAPFQGQAPTPDASAPVADTAPERTAGETAPGATGPASPSPTEEDGKPQDEQ